ncbi:MAG: PASTA domain-containing protein [Candidatus Hydrogenedentes bacterium]|nr:PASTA domain-containing protein [Candidatus Hydrogenedentota bacterium]
MKHLNLRAAARCIGFVVLVLGISGCPPVPKLPVPDLSGLNAIQVNDAIRAAGFTSTEAFYETSETVPFGNVIRQEPLFGATAPSGTSISIFYSLGPQNTVVPNLVGLAQSAAEAAIDEARLELGTVESEASLTVPAGRVIRQTPPADTTVAAFGTVNLVISSGQPLEVIVPNVIGLGQFAAWISLATAGVTVGEMTQSFDPVVPIGFVISQSPEADTVVETGSPVELLISLGPDPRRIVPVLAGLTQSEAETALENVDLLAGTVTKEFSPSVPAGSITSQNPQPGTEVLRDTEVDFVLSLGADPGRIVPDLSGLTRSQAVTALTGVELLLGTVTEEFSETVPEGQIISQSHLAGGLVPPGTAINVVVSLGRLIEINDVEDLQRIGNETAYPLDGQYILINDIDASDTANWNEGLGFEPIGSAVNPFTGTLDGDGFTINGLTINRPAMDYVGLFRYLGVNASIINLVLDGGAIQGRDYVGVLAADCRGAIQQCETRVPVLGNNYVGGMVAWNRGTMEDCSAMGDITATGYAVGGFVGSNEEDMSNCHSSGIVSGLWAVGAFAGDSSGTLAGCTASGDVSGFDKTGGLVGQCRDGEVSDCSTTGTIQGRGLVGGLIGETNGCSVVRCFATGTVTGTGTRVGGLIGDHYGPLSLSFATGAVQGSDSVGGLVGYLGSPGVQYCYATGEVMGQTKVGGFVGRAVQDSGFHRCYATGMVTADSEGGGLVGQIDEPFRVLQSFWDTESSGQSNSATGEGRSTAAMKSQANFEAAEWDFVNVWGIDEGISYPYLLWTVAPAE